VAADAPTFGDDTPAGLKMLTAIFRPRLVRWLVGLAALALICATAYYKLVVVPELTARRFEVEVIGTDARLVVEVDDESDRIVIAGGVNGLSQVFVDGTSLYLRALDVGAETDRTWIEVPLNVIGSPPAVPSASSISDALSVRIKNCRLLDGDAAALISVMVPEVGSNPQTQLCGTAIRNTASAGTVIVDMSDVRPSDITSVPTDSVVNLADVANRGDVLIELDRRLRRGA
jgi:hypothetical protein